MRIEPLTCALSDPRCVVIAESDGRGRVQPAAGRRHGGAVPPERQAHLHHAHQLRTRDAAAPQQAVRRRYGTQWVWCAVGMARQWVWYAAGVVCSGCAVRAGTVCSGYGMQRVWYAVGSVQWVPYIVGTVRHRQGTLSVRCATDMIRSGCGVAWQVNATGVVDCSYGMPQIQTTVGTVCCLVCQRFAARVERGSYGTRTEHVH